MFERKDLIDFIVRLNDRNLTKQNVTGISLWASLGAIVYFSFRLFDDLFAIHGDKVTSFIFLPFLASTINYFYFSALTILALSLIIYGLLAVVEIQQKVWPTFELFFRSALRTHISIFYLLFFLINYLTAMNAPIYKISFWITMGIAYFYLLNGPIVPIYKTVKKNINRKKGIPLFPEIEGGVGTKGNRYILTAGIVILIFSAPELLLNYLNFKGIFSFLSHEQTKLLMKASFEIIGICVLTFFIIPHSIAFLRTTRLEALEKDIYMNELGVEEIRERLEREFFGSDPKAWIVKQREQFSEKATALLDEEQAFESRLSALSKNEYLSRVDTLRTEFINIWQPVENLFNEYASRVNALIKSATAGDIDMSEISIFVDVYKNHAALFAAALERVKQQTGQWTQPLVEDKQKKSS